MRNNDKSEEREDLMIPLFLFLVTFTWQDREDMSLSMYVDYIRKPPCERTEGKLYGKDISAPEKWKDYASTRLPKLTTWCGPSDLLHEASNLLGLGLGLMN